MTQLSPPHAGLARRVLDTLDDAVFTVDHAQRVTLWNRRIAELTGLPGDEVLGRPVFEVVPGWRETEHPHLERALAGATSLSSAFPVAVARRFEASYAPLDDASGALVVVRDVSSSDRARFQLHESDVRFQIMADTAPVLLWMAGTDAHCTFFNRPWLAFTGRPLDMELGTGWAEGVHPEDFARCMDTYLAAFVARRAFRMEYRLRRADRQYRWLLDTGVPRFLPGGEFAGFIGSCIDITEGKLAHNELDRRVRERTAELEAFAYAVSHDLRSPLRSIDGFSLALAEDHAGQLDDDGRNYLHRIRESAQHMGRLIDALLQLSRVGRSQLRFEPVDLTALARAVLGELVAHDPARQVELAVGDDMVVDGDPALLRIALDNLLGNAWKFTGKVARAAIAVSVLRRDVDVVVTVRDNGAGFDMAHARKLFGAFQRLHRTQDFPGTGIGLATVQRIVHRHGGRIWADSSPGHGATFSFTLPMRTDDAG